MPSQRVFQMAEGHEQDAGGRHTTPPLYGPSLHCAPLRTYQVDVDQ
jgi:hypothetical protein